LLHLALTIIDSKLSPRRASHDVYLLVFIFEPNLVGILAVMLVIFYRRFGPLHENMTSSTKPEVSNIRQRATAIGNMHIKCF